MLKNFVLSLFTILFLTACGAAEPVQNNEVQDIKPGEKSMIQSPEQTKASDTKIVEKNI